MFRLNRSRYIDMHPVHFSIAIGIELRLYPQVMTNPTIGILECVYDLRFTVLDDRANSFGAGFVVILGQRIGEQRAGRKSRQEQQ